MADTAEEKRARKDLLEDSAKWLEGFNDTVTTATGSREINRCWTRTTQTDVTHLLDFLEKFTSAKNTTATPYVEDPKVGNETYPGKWRCASIRRIKTARETVIVQTLREIRQPTDAAALGALTPLITHDDEVLAPFGLQPGDEDRIAYLIPDLDPASRATIMGFSNADLVTNLPGAGWTYVARSFKDQPDNTAILAVQFQKETWSNTAPAYTKTRINNEGGYGEASSSLADGVPLASAEGKLAAGEMVLASGYDDKGKGEARVTKVEQTGNELAIITREWPTVGTRLRGAEKTWYRVKPTEVANRYATAKAWSHTAGHIHNSVRMINHPDGFATIIATATDTSTNNTGSLMLASDVTSYDIVRTYVEKSGRKPVGVASDTPADGYYWRTVKTYVGIKLTLGETGAKNWADAGLIGSFSKRIRGFFYAENVTSRTVSDWQSITLKGYADWAPTPTPPPP